MKIIGKRTETLEHFDIVLDNDHLIRYTEYIDDSGKVIDWECNVEVEDDVIEQIQDLIDNESKLKSI